MPEDTEQRTSGAVNHTEDRYSTSTSEDQIDTGLINIDKYEYSPLPDKNYIRLLKLENTGMTDGKVSAKLEVYHLTGQPLKYTTLSYSWGRNGDGNASLCRNIIVNGKLLAVTQNLYDGLLQLRKRNFVKETHIHDPDMFPLIQGESKIPELLWIDAVCINQADNKERNSQVANMANIYGCGSAMIIWLGHGPTPQDDQAIYGLFTAAVGTRFLSRHPTRQPRGLHGVDWSGYRDFVEYSSINRQDMAVDVPVRLVAAAISICERRYFSRRWVIQERYQSSKQPTLVLWASFHLTINAFLRAISWIWAGEDAVEIESNHHSPYLQTLAKNAFETLSFKPPNCLLTPSSTEYLSSAYRKWEPILYCLWTYGFTSCADARDRIYAFSSILEHPSALAPDYALDYCQVFTQFATALVKDGLFKTVLHHATSQVVDHDSNKRDLRACNVPSWVPDYSLPLKGSRYMLPPSSAHCSAECGVLKVSVALADLPDWPCIRMPPAKEGDKLAGVKLPKLEASKRVVDLLVLRPEGSVYQMIDFISESSDQLFGPEQTDVYARFVAAFGSKPMWETITIV